MDAFLGLIAIAFEYPIALALGLLLAGFFATADLTTADFDAFGEPIRLPIASASPIATDPALQATHPSATVIPFPPQQASRVASEAPAAVAKQA